MSLGELPKHSDLMPQLPDELKPIVTFSATKDATNVKSRLVTEFECVSQLAISDAQPLLHVLQMIWYLGNCADIWRSVPRHRLALGERFRRNVCDNESRSNCNWLTFRCKVDEGPLPATGSPTGASWWASNLANRTRPSSNNPVSDSNSAFNLVTRPVERSMKSLHSLTNSAMVRPRATF